MKLCRHMKLLSGVAALSGVFAAGVLLDRPAGSRDVAPVPVSAHEHTRTIDAMRPPKRKRPLVAVLGHNAGTETTDFLVPYGVLKTSDVADVVAVAPEARTMRLRPALAVEPDTTLGFFNIEHHDGADYVIVAAMHPRDDGQVLEWLRQQANKGAIIVGICSGVQTLAAAGLLDGRRATSYWYDADDLADAYPGTTWVRDRRYVVDGNIVTTTGISASMPISLALVEAIAGPRHARVVAHRLGVQDWGEGHDGASFGFDRRMIGNALDNKLAFWRHETVAVPVAPGVDEIALAFTADAWSRTFATEVVSAAPDAAPVTTRHGLRVRPDRALGDVNAETMLPAVPSNKPALALPESLAAIERRYGRTTRAFVATQLEHREKDG